MKALSKSSLERNDGSEKGVGEHEDILTEGTVLLCCRGMLGKGSESTTIPVTREVRRSHV